MEKKTISGIMLALLFISMLTLAFNTTPVQADIKVTDDFNDNTINPDLWSAGQTGGPTVNEINQRLEIFFPRDSAGEYFGAGYSSKYLLRGDFDIQVDFSLLNWPSVDQLGTGNGVRIGLAVGEGGNWWSMQRVGYGSLAFDFPGYPREVYACDFAGSLWRTPTGDMSGKLRLVRSSDTLTGYYFSSGSWFTVASGWVTTGDVSFSPTAWSHDYAFMDSNVLLAFDNFIVNNGRLIAWPPKEEWHPMSLEEARPQMRRIPIYGGNYYLGQGESFCLSYGWFSVPTNKAYNLATGQLETVTFPNLQDGSDSANALYTVTMNGQPLEPTYSFTGTCKWLRYTTGEGHVVVLPRSIHHEYYIVFPEGLLSGEYTIVTCIQPVNPRIYSEPFSFTVTLHVGSARVGLILAIGGLGDKSFNDISYAGVQRAKDELGIDFVYAQPTNIAEYEGYQRDFARSGDYEIIICVGWDQADALTKVAAEYPSQKFAIVDNVVDKPNLASLLFKQNEGSFLVGVVAGMKTKTGKVGFVGGMDIPLIRDFFIGYEAGAKWANSTVEVLEPVFVGGWADPTAGKELALALADAGVDVIYAAAGKSGLGVLEGVHDRGVLGLGVDACQCYLYPEVIASMTKRVDVAIFKTIETAIEETFQGGIHHGGLIEGWVGCCRLPEEEDFWEGMFSFTHTFLDSSVASKMDEARDKIVAGEISVPTAYG